MPIFIIYKTNIKNKIWGPGIVTIPFTLISIIINHSFFDANKNHDLLMLASYVLIAAPYNNQFSFRCPNIVDLIDVIVKKFSNK